MRVRVCVRVRPPHPARSEACTHLQVEPSTVHLTHSKGGGSSSFSVDAAVATEAADERSCLGFAPPSEPPCLIPADHRT